MDQLFSNQDESDYNGMPRIYEFHGIEYKNGQNDFCVTSFFMYKLFY